MYAATAGRCEPVPSPERASGGRTDTAVARDSTTMTTPPVLWAPADDALDTTRLGAFLRACEERTGASFAGYDELWRWSTDAGLEECWAAIWDFFEVRASEPYDQVLDRRTMPGARWFGGARLNYAEHICRMASGRESATATPLTRGGSTYIPETGVWPQRTASHHHQS